eukprot:363869-Chlamydomonas_euryale.AAC.42
MRCCHMLGMLSAALQSMPHVCCCACFGCAHADDARPPVSSQASLGVRAQLAAPDATAGHSAPPARNDPLMSFALDADAFRQVPQSQNAAQNQRPDGSHVAGGSDTPPYVAGSPIGSPTLREPSEVRESHANISATCEPRAISSEGGAEATAKAESTGAIASSPTSGQPDADVAAAVPPPSTLTQSGTDALSLLMDAQRVAARSAQVFFLERTASGAWRGHWWHKHSGIRPPELTAPVRAACTP